MGEGGVKNPEILPTLFMDGPLRDTSHTRITFAIYLRTFCQSEMREIGLTTKVELLIEIFLVL